MDTYATTIETISSGLQEELGKRLVIRREDDPTAPIAYCHPGAEHPVLIFFHDEPLGPILRIDALVTDRADWISPGLAEMLLHEQSGWIFGRAERRGDGIVIEHNLPADTSPDQIASVVIGLAGTALHLRADLARMGALMILEEAA